MKNSIFDSPLIVNQNFFQKLNSLLANQILLIVCIFNKPNVWYFRSLKILAIKTVIPFNFAKILQGRHFALDGPKNFKLLPDVFFLIFFFLSKNCIVEFIAVFVWLLWSWSTIVCKIYLEFARLHWKSWFELKV